MNLNQINHCIKYANFSDIEEVANRSKTQTTKIVYGNSPIIGRFKMTISSESFWINVGSGTGAKDAEKGAKNEVIKSIKTEEEYIVSPTSYPHEDAPQIPTYRGYNNDMKAQVEYRKQWLSWAESKLSNL